MILKWAHHHTCQTALHQIQQSVWVNVFRMWNTFSVVLRAAGLAWFGPDGVLGQSHPSAERRVETTLIFFFLWVKSLKGLRLRENGPDKLEQIGSRPAFPRTICHKHFSNRWPVYSNKTHKGSSRCVGQIAGLCLCMSQFKYHKPSFPAWILDTHT